jgi:YgiT-type zinc finger domain-containing protein
MARANGERASEGEHGELEQRAEEDWAALSAQVLSGMRDWRAQHPHASLREIETALDERLARMRARLLQDVAQASPAADWSHARVADRPTCPSCGERLQPRGKRTRRLKTLGGQQLTLQRTSGVCPACGQELFPPR